MKPNSAQIEAGALRHRVTIVANASGEQDSTGGVSLSNTTPVLGCWAEIRTVSGSETLGAGAEVSTVQKLVTIRYPKDTTITAAMQVLFQGRKFQIVSVENPDERTRKLVLRCVEINDSREQSA
jgi:SPP1 family predicted phage head-tail adaptor